MNNPYEKSLAEYEERLKAIADEWKTEEKECIRCERLFVANNTKQTVCFGCKVNEGMRETMIQLDVDGVLDRLEPPRKSAWRRIKKILKEA